MIVSVNSMCETDDGQELSTDVINNPIHMSLRASMMLFGKIIRTFPDPKYSFGGRPSMVGYIFMCIVLINTCCLKLAFNNNNNKNNL